jgi:hypothetical protein
MSWRMTNEPIKLPMFLTGYGGGVSVTAVGQSLGSVCVKLLGFRKEFMISTARGKLLQPNHGMIHKSDVSLSN